MTPTAPQRSTLAVLLLGGLVPAMGVVLVVGVVFWITAGRSGAATALVGGLLGAVVLAVGMVGLSRVVRSDRTGGQMSGLALLLFSAQIGITALLLWVLVGQSWVTPRTLAIAFIAGGLAFQIGSSIAFLRARVPVVEPADPTHEPTDGATSTSDAARAATREQP